MRYFISGISSGIGRSLADRFAAQNHSVQGLGRQAMKFNNSAIQYRQIDLSELSTLHDKLIPLIEPEPSLDVGILNAASLGEIKPLNATDLTSLKSLMDTNLWAQKIILDALLNTNKSLKQVVAISTGAAVRPAAGWNGYSISKAAFKTMIEIYAQEYPDVHFISLAPGLVETPMQYSLNKQAQQNRVTGIPTVEELKSNNSIASPTQFAEQFDALLPTLIKHESGSYLDIRSLKQNG